MEGSWSPLVGPENRYQYNGKELNGEFGLDLYEYGFRWYDSALGRFIGVDPIADDFAWVNVYNYAENSPIANIDLHGLQKVSIHSRSFIPYKTLGMFGEGGSFAGDNRGFGDEGNSRISARIDLNLSGKGITKVDEKYKGANTFDSDGNQLVYSTATGKSTLGDNEIADGKVAATDLEFHVFGNNDAIPGSPDIDVRGAMGIGVTDFEDGSSIVYMSGKIAGDKFPANETFLTDQNNNRIYLGVSGADGRPITSLLGDNYREMSSFSVSINFDANGKATGINYNGKNYSIDNWNQQFTQQNAASDVSTKFD